MTYYFYDDPQSVVADDLHERVTTAFNSLSTNGDEFRSAFFSKLTGLGVGYSTHTLVNNATFFTPHLGGNLLARISASNASEEEEINNSINDKVLNLSGLVVSSSIAGKVYAILENVTSESPSSSENKRYPTA